MADTVVKVDEMTRKRDRTRNVMETAKACSEPDRSLRKVACRRVDTPHEGGLRCIAR